MALSKRRKEIRIISLKLAASMIEDYHSAGPTLEEAGVNNEDELEILSAENDKTAKRLRSMAERLKN